MLAQELIAQVLPWHLAEFYGADPNLVGAKVELYHFDWKDFIKSDCARSAMKE
jgi:hypothetical protein